MASTREWPKSRLGVVAGGLLLVSGFLATARWGLDRGHLDAAMALGYLVSGCWAVERELWTWRLPGARLDAQRLEILPAAFAEKAVVTPLDEVTGIDWESLGYIALRLRSGEVRTISTRVLRRRDRAEFAAALHDALAAPRAA